MQPTLAYAAPAPELPGSANPARAIENNQLLPEPQPVAPASVAPVEPLPENPAPPGADKVMLEFKGIKLEGVTVYDTQDLASIYTPYIGKQISLSKIYDFTNAITARYQRDGYVLSKAVLPPQKIGKDGIIRVQVIEGYVNSVELQGAPQKSYITDAIANRIAHYRPLNIKDLERDILLLNDLAGVSAQTVLKPITAPGAPVGAVDMAIVFSHVAFQSSITADNFNSRYVGPYETGIQTGVNNLLPYGQTTLNGTVSVPFSNLQYIQASQRRPLDSEGTTATLAVAYAHTHPGYTLEPDDIESDSYNYSLSLAHPFLRSRAENFYLSTGLTLKNIHADIMESELYVDRLSIVNLSAEYDLSDRFAGANLLQMKLNQGLQDFGATANGNGSGTQFLSRSEGRSDFTDITANIGRLQGSDSFTGLLETYNNANAGTGKTLTVGYTSLNDGNSGGNYTVTKVTNNTGVINKEAITLTAATNTKTYDSTTSAAATPTITSGALQGSDSFTGLTETYDNANAGSGKTLTVGYTSLSDGNSGGNYLITTVANTTGVINKEAITITAATDTKTYDATTSSMATPTITSGALQGSDSFTGLTETYDNANAGSGKTLTVAYTSLNDGNSGNNYTVTTATNTTGVINKEAITLIAASNTKTYDSTTTAAATPIIISGALQGSDNFTGLKETYDNANAGSGKTLTVGYTSLNDGNSGNNYNVTTMTNTSGIINKEAITITAATNTKTYDSTNSASATPTITSGALQGSDTFTGLTETYNNANAGTGKTLTVSYTSLNDGNGGGNYTVTKVVNTSGVINKEAITVTAATNTKTYDSTTSASGTPTVTSGALQGSDSFTGLTETYDNANAGTGKTLSVGYTTLNDGNGGNNYTVTLATNTTGIINKEAITVTAATSTKTYDSTTSSTATPTVTSGALQGSDSFTGLTETYDNANTGSSKTLTPTYISLNDGNSGGNYTVTFATNATGVINKEAITLTAASNTKTYDSTNSAAATPAITNGALQGSDSFTGLSETYNNINAGNGKTLTVVYTTLNDGNSGNNYTVTLVTNTTGIINKAPLTVATNNQSKTYGDADPAYTGTVTGLTTYDATTEGVSFAYAPQSYAGNAGSYTIGATATDTNNRLANYTITDNYGTLTVAQRTLTVTLTGTVEKTYDQMDTATLASGNYVVSNIVNSDNVTLNNPASGTYDNATAGMGKTVSVSGLTLGGTAVGNYTLAATTTSGAVGIIDPKTVTAAVNGVVEKVYDGTTNLVLSPSNYGITGVISGDNVTVSAAGSYADANAGTNKTVVLTGLSLSGAQAVDYTLTSSTANVSGGQIDPKPITVAFTSTLSKTYGTANPTISLANFTFTGLVNSGDNALFTSITPNYNGIGINSPISASGTIFATIGSTNNYTVSNVPATYLTINPAILTIATDTQGKQSGSPDPIFTGTYSGLTAYDSTQNITFTYAPAGYNGNVGTYTIVSIANDPAGRLANYTISSNYGIFIVVPANTALILPSTVANTISTPVTAIATSSNYILPSLSETYIPTVSLNTNSPINSPGIGSLSYYDAEALQKRRLHKQ